MKKAVQNCTTLSHATWQNNCSCTPVKGHDVSVPYIQCRFASRKSLGENHVIACSDVTQRAAKLAQCLDTGDVMHGLRWQICHSFDLRKVLLPATVKQQLLAQLCIDRAWRHDLDLAVTFCAKLTVSVTGATLQRVLRHAMFLPAL